MLSFSPGILALGEKPAPPHPLQPPSEAMDSEYVKNGHMQGYQTTFLPFEEVVPATPLQPWGNDCPILTRSPHLPGHFLEALVKLLISGQSAKAPGDSSQNTLTQYLPPPCLPPQCTACCLPGTILSPWPGSQPQSTLLRVAYHHPTPAHPSIGLKKSLKGSPSHFWDHLISMFPTLKGQ